MSCHETQKSVVPRDMQVVLVPGDSAIRSIADLKGKRVGYVRATTTHRYLNRMPAEIGLFFAGIQPVNLSPSDGLAAFRNGALDAWAIAFIAPAEAESAMGREAVDGWATWSPCISLAKVEDGAREIVNGPGAAISARGDALGDFLRRARLARDRGLANARRQAEVRSAQTGFPLAVARDVAATAAPRTAAIDDAVVAAQQRVSGFFAAARVIARKREVAPPAFDRGSIGLVSGT